MEEIDITLPKENVLLKGILAIPKGATKIVAFAHGSGSGRLSPRNQFVAETLQNAGIATLLLDLLTPSEEALDEMTRAYRFNIPLLSSRLLGACTWLSRHEATAKLKVGLFGSSTGAAAALIAASQLGKKTLAVISRGGRSDLADDRLASITCPVLFLVGSDDPDILSLNTHSLSLLSCEKKITIIEGASHLFEEPGTLDQVATLATDWFTLAK